MTPAILRAVPDTPLRAIIYLRQSTYKEESISLEMQEIACRDYCARNGYDVVAVEADPGISGRTWNRPAVQRTMQALDDRQTDVVVLWKWSRLSRSRKDWALAIDRADLAGGRIESATEPIDTATASGRFARGVMTEFSAYQSELIGEVWEEVRQRRLGKGLPASGRLPYGWRWVKGHGIEQHPDQAPHVVEMYDRYLSGEGAAQIAKRLNDRGVPGPNGAEWTRARPLTVMDSPIHAGLIPYRGETYQGEHEGIIDDTTWTRYQSERTRRRETNAKPREYEHLLSNLLRCECGHRMHGKGSVTGGHWYGGYLCSHTLGDHPQRAYVSAKRIDPAVTDWFLTFDPEVTTGTSRNAVAERAERDRLLREIADLNEQTVNLARELGKGDRSILPRASIEAAAADVRDELARRQAEVDRMRPEDDSRPSQADLAPLRSRWKSMTKPEKNFALRRYIARIDILDDGTRVRITTEWGYSSEVDV